MPPFLDSRGLVRLRLGDHAGALTDYAAALASNPKGARSRYGRGIAKKALGRVDESKADIDAAVVVDPDIPKKAAVVVLVP